MIDFHIHNKGKDLRDFTEMVKRANSLGINHMVLLGDVLAFGLEPSEAQVEEINDWTISIKKHFQTNLTAFIFLNPKNSKNFIIKEIKRCLSKGLQGIKLEAALNARSPLMGLIVETALEFELPLLHHCWNKSLKTNEHESDSTDLAVFAAKYPDLKIIAAHLSGIGINGIADLAPYKNVYIDTSGGQPETGFIEYAVKNIGPERLLFGSDAYGFHGRDQACQLAKIKFANISAKDKEKIFGLNAKKLLKLL